MLHAFPLVSGVLKQSLTSLGLQLHQYHGLLSVYLCLHRTFSDSKDHSRIGLGSTLMTVS